MASNVLPGVGAAWPGGNAGWGRRLLPLAPAAQVGGADATQAHTSRESSESATNADSIPPHNHHVTVAAASARAMGNAHLQHPMCLPHNPYFPNAHGVTGAPSGTNGQGSVAGNRHDQHCSAVRVMLLESEIKNARTHNFQLQHHVAYLQTQIGGQLGHIASLHDKIRALESELASRQATDVAVGANSAPENSIPTSTTPLVAPASAAGFGPRLPEQPVPRGGIGAATEGGPVGSSGAPSESATVSPPSVSTRNEIALAASSAEGLPSTLNETHAAPTADATPTESVVAQQAESSNGVETESDVDVNKSPAVAAPKKPRNALTDFWNDGSPTVDYSPPSSNTRNHRLRAASVGSAQQTDSPSSLPTEHVTSDEGRADAPTESEPVQGVAAQTHVDGTTAVARTGGDEPATAVAEPASETQPQTPLAPILRRATEGSKGADDRSSHLMGCAYCEETLPVGASIGWCERCPRSFCPRCLERGLGDQGVHIEELGRGCRALLRGERGDFLIAQCPLCVCGGDKGFAPPPQGALAMDHLLAELLRHDLSICFRESVDIVEHPDYLESIGRQNMMDLGTMLGKLKNRRYPRRRGPGQFLDDLNRIWRNCRKYAGCDELGQPYCGTTVPGIVRCALTLEAMSIRFCATHMSDQTWQESTWDYHRQKQERENAEARLKSLEKSTGMAMEVTAGATDGRGVDVTAVGKDGRGSTAGGSESSSSGTISETSAEVEKERLGDNMGNRSSSATGLCATGGRKRKAAAPEGAAKGGGVNNKRARVATRTVPDATTAASAADGSGASPPIVHHPAGKAKQLQPPWSPLDKLCDLATTLKNDALITS